MFLLYVRSVRFPVVGGWTDLQARAAKRWASNSDSRIVTDTLL
jgi:hypothetical protein